MFCRYRSQRCRRRESSTCNVTPTASIGWILKTFSFYRMDVVDVYSVGASCLASISVNVPRQVLLFGASMVGEVPMYSQGAFSLEQGDPSTSQSGNLHRPLRYCTPASTI